jgi:hypothetical protein
MSNEYLYLSLGSLQDGRYISCRRPFAKMPPIHNPSDWILLGIHWGPKLQWTMLYGLIGRCCKSNNSNRVQALVTASLFGPACVVKLENWSSSQAWFLIRLPGPWGKSSEKQFGSDCWHPMQNFRIVWCLSTRPSVTQRSHLEKLWPNNPVA